MKFPILASLIVFILVLSRAIRRNRQTEEEIEQQFWEREKKANSVRKKSLDHLDYIQIPTETLPLSVPLEDAEALDCVRLLRELSEQKIVNLTGYSNTDLKLEYGTANITPLSEYDQNYTLLVRTLQRYADILLQNSYDDEARQILEFALGTHTDISRTYYQLAELYVKSGNPEKVSELIHVAEELNSSNRNTILRKLRTYVQE